MQSKSISHKVLAVLSVLFAQVFVDVHAMIFALDVEIRLKNDVASTTTTATTTTILHVRVPLKESTDTTVDSPYYGRLPKFERMEAKTLLNKIRDLYGTERKTDESLPELPDVSHLALTLVTPGNDLGREFEPSDDVSVSIMEIGTYGHQSRLAVIDKRDQKPERIRRVVDESQLQQNQIVAGGIGTEDHFVVVQMTHEKVVCFRPQSGLISFLRSSLMKSDERLFKHQGRRSSSSSSSSSNANKKKQGLDPFSIRLRLSELSRHSHKIIAIVQKNTCAADADAGQEESDQTENKHSNNPESNDVDTFIGQAQTEGEAQDGSGPSWYQLESDVRLSLASLARFFQDELDTIHSHWQEILDSGSVSFDSLAVFLGEGSEVVTESADGFLQGGRVTDIEYIAMNARQGGFLASWTITVQTVTSNGINFGPLSTKIQIADFSPKLIPIKELGIRPISADERRFLTERGKLYRNLAIGAHHKSYMGPILLPRDHRTKEPSRTVRADGRIMVDIEHFHIQQTGNVPTLNSRHLLMYERQHSRADQSSAFQDQNKGENMQRESDSALNDSDLWTTPPSIPAFSFRQHRFGICHIELMSDIVWRTEAWNQLVLPEVKKELIRALILQTRSQAEVDRLERRRWKETSLMNTTSSTHGQISEDAKETDKELSNEMDIVQGKGGGCTMLLHGKSGTGKFHRDKNYCF